MRRVTAFVGAASRKHTRYAAGRFLAALESLGGVEGETVVLSDHRLESCRGCKICFERGESYCPLKDDRDALIDMMHASDGVVLATPNYSFQVSGIMKSFLDRFGCLFHRPCFFGKFFTSIVVQGFHGGPAIVKYLDFVGNGLGFNTVKGSCITALDPMTDKERHRIDGVLTALAARFHRRMSRSAFPSPSLLKLLILRMSRTNVRLLAEETSCDYEYYKDKGWLESEYFYPVRLNPLQRFAGSLFDHATAKRAQR